jgi:hypothetical protein
LATSTARSAAAQLAGVRLRLVELGLGDQHGPIAACA